MKIWIDGYEANVPQRLGSSQVAFELLKNLEKIDKKNEYTILLPSVPMDDLPKERTGWKYKILKPSKLWTRIALPVALLTSKNRPDVFFSPTHYTPWVSPVKMVSTIFDLSYLHFPRSFQKKDLWQLTNWSRDSIQKSTRIITISNSTKKDIIKNYAKTKKQKDLLSQKITVAYPGYNSEVFKQVKDVDVIENVTKKYGIYGNYVIFIGTIQPRKNLSRLIELFKKIDNLKLVVVGKTKGLGRSAWKYEDILALPKKLGIEERVIFAGFVPNADLNLLLNGASAFVLPSLWEGFGIPVVDAMATGCPVIVSNVSSLPEVVGKAGLLVNPISEDQIEQAIRLITTDKKLALKKSKEGLEQKNKFSWEKMSRIVLKVMEEING